MIAGYRDGRHFAYPGWRLRLPGGPAGGHYKGFTHTQAAGTDIPPGDNYEQDREDGMSSSDSVHASLSNPRGVYRSSGEVPPRPNASGSAHTFRSFQRQHHPGQAVAPGSFPADFVETNEDDFLPARPNTVSTTMAGWLGATSQMMISDGELFPGSGRVCPAWGCGGPPIIWNREVSPQPSVPPVVIMPPATGATSVVNQPAPTPVPLPPAQSIPVATVPPVSPTPAPIVATNEVVPLNDGSGNYVNISTGAIVPASTVTQNLATMQLTTGSAVAGQLIPLQDGSGNYLNPQTGAVIPGAAISQSAAAVPALTSFSMAGALTWLEQPSTFFPSIPNWGLVAGAAAAAMFFMGRKKR
jgi:hypothetical protein